MIRYVLVLVLGMGAALAVLGEDHGQRRLGLTEPPQRPKPLPLPPLDAEPATAVFLPVKPHLVSPPAPAAEVTEVADTVAAQPAVAVASAARPTLVAIQGANLRGGPGRTYGVLASLKTGDLVQVLEDDDAASGWRHVRLDEQDIEGWVAAKLLAAGTAD